MLLPRNDIMTQPFEGEGEGHNCLLIFMLKGSFLLADVLYELQLYRVDTQGYSIHSISKL